MITVDYLLVNEDRHQNNFGVIRNAETLEYLGPTPLYVSGTSLWSDKPTAMIGGGRVVCKPFKNGHEEQIKLVASFDWLDLSKLDGIEEAWMELTRGAPFLDESRRNAVARALRGHIDRLRKLSRTWFPRLSDAVAGDVMEDTKYSSQSR